MKPLVRFWIEFESSNAPSALNLGCGVTAIDYDDAIGLIASRIFERRGLPAVLRVEENVDVSLLDEKHVLPNIGDTVVRGIWFPLGYER